MLINSKIVNGVFQEYIGRQLQLQGELEVYLNQPVGVGDHTTLSNSVKELILELSTIDEQIATIQRYFSVQPEGEAQLSGEDQPEAK